MKKKKIILLEAAKPTENEDEKEFMTDKEEKLKKKLIALLRDDGKGNHHAKFAERLEDFIIKIVLRKDDPNMTCAVSWDDITIYISEGFIQNPNTFGQLNVLMRHELAHYLMQHELRMMQMITKKYGKEGWTHIKVSQSLHELMNIIEDFEISNKRYTKADKIAVRNMLLFGRLIGGLVTEDHREDWKDLSVVEMYKELCAEIDQIQKKVLDSWKYYDGKGIPTENDYYDKNDGLKTNIKHTLYIYTGINNPTNFLGDLDKFIKGKAYYHFFPKDQMTESGQVRPCMATFKVLPEPWQNTIKAVREEFYDNANYVKQDLRDRILEIAQTNPTRVYDLKDKNGGLVVKLYTPEEKLFAGDALKACIPTLENYQTWFDKAKRVFSDKKYSDQDLQDVLDALDK